jgi:tetratricopeptide (TPR) repeat protein
MSFLAKPVFDLNNHGLACIAKGDYASAVDCFRQALLTISYAVSSGQQQQVHGTDGLNPTSASQNKMTQSLSIVLPSQFMFPPSDTSGILPIYSDGIAFSMHQSLEQMFFPGDSSSAAHHHHHAGAMCASVLTFNCALAFHRCALGAQAGARQCKSRLLKAKALYEKSQCLLESFTNGGRCASGVAFIDLLSMALLYNMAHISHHWLRYDESQKYAEQLREFISSSVLYNDEKESTAMGQLKVIFFFRALPMLNPPTIAPAA